MITCPDFSRCKIIVVGDAMLDRYWHGDTSRISPEAPVPVVKIERNEERVGGAANVALNVRVLGASTTRLISVVGEDEVGRKLSQMLEERQVGCDFIVSPALNTTLKLRVLGRHQQLIRLDFEDKHAMSTDQILEKLAKVIDDADILILSDYAKGMITQPEKIIDFAKQKGVKVLVDPKSADLSVYRGATVLTPNLGEFESTVGYCANEAEIETKGNQLLEKLNLEALLVTRGSQGMTLLQKNRSAIHIPAQAREVFDITGAGDTVIAVLGSCLAAKISIEDAAKLANVAAGLSVGKLGTATITRDELQAALLPQYCPRKKGAFSLNALLPEIQQRKAEGSKIVMTNGCFDILHAGHVTYLQQARALGDYLIVAVNDDNSVRRLKGSQRPINSLQDRMQVLAALDCVDYVIAFSEDTPQNLIAQLLPHLLIKGGDYTPEQIAGGAEVIQNGGEVKIMPLVPGRSTTKMVEKILNTPEPA